MTRIFVALVAAAVALTAVAETLTPAEKKCLAKHAEGAKQCVKNQCSNGRWEANWPSFAECEAFCLVANIEAGKQDCLGR